jgi:L-threonylcarbamoyladenylate synthase
MKRLTSIPATELIYRAAEILRAGGLVAFPTETVYGLGANALSEVAVRRIFEAKGRPASNPIIVHVASIDAARQLTGQWNDTAQKLAAHFWPGSLSLVLPRHSSIPDAVTAGGPTVAIRIPNHPIALSLMRVADLPIAAPSANRSNSISPTTAQHVAAGLDGKVDMILDGGPCSGGIESTVVYPEDDRIVLLRPGGITISELESVAGVPVVTGGVKGARPVVSPGMLPRHYAPKAKLILSPCDSPECVERLLQSQQKIAWIRIGAGAAINGVTVAEMPDNPVAYAALLYKTLHDMDHQSVDIIVCDTPPDQPEWLGVRDRLSKASVDA